MYDCSFTGVEIDFTNTAVVTGNPPIGPQVSDEDTAFVDSTGEVLLIELVETDSADVDQLTRVSFVRHSEAADRDSSLETPWQAIRQEAPSLRHDGYSSRSRWYH